MQTTVTGMFSNQQLASLAASRLARAGFTEARVQLVDASTPARHEFIESKTADTKRAVLLGLALGSAGGLLAGAALGGVFGLAPGLLLCVLAGAIGGATLGLIVGRSTTSQIRDELENQVEAGSVLLSVTADCERESELLKFLAAEKGIGIVSTASSFTAAALPGATG